MLYWTLALAVFALLSGYALGRMHRRETEQEKLLHGEATWLVRPRRKPHTEETIREFPLPEEQIDRSTVTEAQWGRPELPNSGVRWQ